MSNSRAEEINSDPGENVGRKDTTERAQEDEREIDRWFWNIVIQAMLHTRCGLLMGLVVMVYSSIHMDVPKTSNPPQAMQFFINTTNSPIRDYYKGEMSMILSSTKESDISFIMFYAPWDRKSQEVRKEFEIVANFMQKTVNFGAVNCWQPDGECQKRYSKVYSWPVFVVYFNENQGLPYNGPFRADYMIKFLNLIKSPIERIKDGIHFLKFRASHDVVVLANLDMFDSSSDYDVFYSSALRFLENDPFADVGFGVKTENGGYKKKLTIYTWDDTYVHYSSNWTTNGIISWLQKHMQKVTSWVSPSGQKSTLLANYLQPGPSLILFTPRKILLESNYYLMLREIDLELHDCKNNLEIHALRFTLRTKRFNRYFLNNFNDDLIDKTVYNNTVTASNNFYTNTTICLSNFHKDFDQFGFPLNRNMVIEAHPKRNTDSLKANKKPIYKNYYKTSILPDNLDEKSPENLQKLFTNNENELKEFAKSYYSIKTFKNEMKPFITNELKGLLCNSNRTLTLLAMDSSLYYSFLRNFNVNLKNNQKTSAIIVDDINESFYVLNKPVNDVNLRGFIKMFLENNLNRSKSSKIDKVRKNDLITDLNADSFLKFSKQKKAVVIYFYTKHCAFCSGISFKVLEVAKLLENVENLAFGRIDGDLNTLPWEFTMEKLPTFLFFPDEKKSETRVFPRSTQITITTLINFILTNLSPTLKVHAMWAICMKIKFEIDQNKCISSVRLETLSLIERTLHEWRKAQNEIKGYIIDKLSSLRHLHLILGQKNKYTVQEVQKLFVKLTKK